MPDTRYLRPRPTRTIGDQDLATIAAQVAGPPGQLGHLPPNPARFRGRAGHPPTRRGVMVIGGGFLFLTLWLGVAAPGLPTQATARYIDTATVTATVTATTTNTQIPTDTATASPTSTATASPTSTATASPTSTATVVIEVATEAPTMTPRPVSRPVSLPPTQITPLPPPIATTVPPTVLPSFPVTPGTGAAGNDFCKTCFDRSATVHSPTATP